MDQVTLENASPPALAAAIAPAPVIAVNAGQATVLINGVSCEARLAIHIGYRPTVGDEVLVAHDAATQRCWIIGVLNGQAAVDLCVSGDLRLRAPRGSIELHARDGIKVHGRVFEVCVQLVEVVSHTMRQRLATLVQHISGPWTSRCRSQQTVVDEERIEQSERAHVRTSKEYTLNGSTIHLG